MAAAGPAIIQAEITALLLFPGILMGPITVMWAPTISLTSNITDRTLVTGRMLTQAAGTFEGIIADIAAGCITARTVAIFAASTVVIIAASVY